MESYKNYLIVPLLPQCGNHTYHRITRWIEFLNVSILLPALSERGVGLDLYLKPFNLMKH